MLLLFAIFLLFLMLRHNINAKTQDAEPAQTNVTVQVTPTPDPDAIIIAGKTVSRNADTFEAGGVALTAEDCWAIASLPQLTTLSLNNCGITDLFFLSGLTGLRTLYLPDNSISSLAPLTALTNLSTLYIDNNPVTDFSPLASLPHLTTLSIKGVSILDYVLEELQQSMPGCSIFSDKIVESARPISLGGLVFTEDEVTLDLSNRAISDISKLAYCLQLQDLNLSGNPLENVAILSGLPKLQRLNLSGTDLSDEEILPICTLQNLQWLDLCGNPSLSAEGIDQVLASLPNCEVLHDDVLYKVTFADRTFTSDATEIDITACGAASLAGLEKFTELRRLVVYGNGLTELSPLYGLSNLTELDAAYNNLSDITGLNNHAQLKKLVLAHNDLTDIYPLASCTGLEELDLSFNNISYITHLEGLSNLRMLNLMGNPALTGEQILTLQRTIPNCTILTDTEMPEAIPEFTPEPEAEE